MTNVFYASLCHVCKEFSSDLKQCSGCKTFLYCSREHQRRDWREHKQLCKVIQLTNNTVSYEIGCSIQEWKRYRLELQVKWRGLLKRKLFAYENQVWMFPRACGQCFSKKGLKDCRKCLNVAYCCAEHEKAQKGAHETLCGKFKLCMDIERLLICNKKQYPIVNCIPHSTERVDEFPGNINEVLLRFFAETDDDSIDFALKSDCVTTFATLAHVLYKFVKEDFLVCHVVGAASFEAFTDWNGLSQNLFHSFPTIKTIKWFLIGPDADYHTTEGKICDFCTKQNRFYTINTHRELYENVVNALPVPNMVIALNSGIHEFAGSTEENTWKRSIPYLLKNPNVPLLLTAYTKGEILQDRRCIDDSISVKVLMEAQVNKYASLRPIRDWDDEENATSVFYTNGYIAVLEKKCR